MIIHAISDLHGYEPDLPSGDLLIVAGDCTTQDSRQCWHHFSSYLDRLDYKRIVLVAGNHDGHLADDCEWVLSILPRRVTYLQDELLMLEDGTKIYGFPWTPTFHDWHFMIDRGPVMRKMVQRIPDGIDILVSHGPPRGILDGVPINGNEKLGFRHMGCDDMAEELKRIRPKVHLFGHIHEQGHKTVVEDGITYHNVSAVDRGYELQHGITEIHLP